MSQLLNNSLDHSEPRVSKWLWSINISPLFKIICTIASYLKNYIKIIAFLQLLIL